jgi:hypothetical protein
MNHRPLHMHSMLVHSVVALAPVAAATILLGAGHVTVLSIGPDVWNLLLWTSLIGMIALVIPATLTGISERNHAYANWFPSHRYKLALSLLLMLVVLVELIGLARSMSTSRPLWLVLSIVVGNCSLVAGLSYFGLRITLGRQALIPTSYTPDMDLKPPVDILASVAEYASDAPKLIDVREDAAG